MSGFGDGGQQIRTQYQYEPYGATTQTSAVDVSSQQKTARFISEDPIGWATGQTNAYAYVNGNQVQFNDPYGLHKGDQWYGYSDKNFRDWVHGIKQDEGIPGPVNYTKPMRDDFWSQWMKHVSLRADLRNALYLWIGCRCDESHGGRDKNFPD